MCFQTALSPLASVSSHSLPSDLFNSETSDSTGFIAEAWLNRGQCHYQCGQLARSLTYFEAALQYFAQIQDEKGIGRSLNGLSAVYLAMGEYPRSRSYSQTATIILQALSAPADYAEALCHLGISHFKLDNLAAAQVCFEQALTLYTSLHNKSRENSLLLTLGQTYAQQKQYMFALACYEALLDNLFAPLGQAAIQQLLPMTLNSMRQLCEEIYAAGAIAAYQAVLKQHAAPQHPQLVKSYRHS